MSGDTICSLPATWGRYKPTYSRGLLLARGNYPDDYYRRRVGMQHYTNMSGRNRLTWCTVGDALALIIGHDIVLLHIR